MGRGTQRSPTLFWPFGQSSGRFSPFTAFAPEAGRLALFVREGSGAHNCELLEQTEANVQVAVSALASGNYFPDYSLVLTGTFISILPLLAIFLVLGRQIIGGIMQGAVKA